MKNIFLLSLFFSSQIHPFLIIGHRGACGYEPENTLASFARAIDMGLNMIELDVYVCKTGELVVHHDDDVDRMTDGHGNVIDMTFAELRALKVARTQQIPTLQEVIDLVARRVPINIELKGPGTAKPVAELIQKYLKSSQDFVVSSFDHEQLFEFKKLCPNIKIGALFAWWNMPENIVAVAQHCQATFIGLDAKAVTQEMVNDAYAAGFPVYVWTVNDKVTADKMRSFGVDGIFANYPDRVR